MLVQLIKGTIFNGYKKEGTILEVKNEIARRWLRNNIAVPCSEVAEPKYIEANTFEDVEPKYVEDTEPEVPQTLIDLSTKSAKELFKMCVEQQIEVEPKMEPAYYIEKLTAN